MSALDTTNWACPGCQAILTTQTAAAHDCWAATGDESENAGEAADTTAQCESGPTGDGAQDDGWRQAAALQAWLFDVQADYAALTARLAAVEAERDALRVALGRIFRLSYTSDTTADRLTKAIAWSEAALYEPEESTDDR